MPFSSSTNFDCLQIDLTGPIVKVFLTLKVMSCSDGHPVASSSIGISHNFSTPLCQVENAPTASEASRVLLAFTPTEFQPLSIVKATRAEGKRKKKAFVPLSVQASELATTAPDAPRLYSVLLSTPLKPGDATTLEVLYMLTHSLEPFPAEISQSESQLVYYRDSAVLLSPYHVLEQVTYIKMPSNRIESFTRVDPTTRAGSEVKYGTYSNQMPNSYLPVLVHYENNRPFAVVEELVRKVEISHWGNIQITEQYKLKHGGARHKGVFSRL
jgi:oligosaccharyltransferase complex subunit alpha (ribophorin I)